MALYLDVLVIAGVLVWAAYHVWLCCKVRGQPHSAMIGRVGRSRRHWMDAILKGDDDQNKLAVQTLQNFGTEFAFKATMSIALSTGLAALLGVTSNANTPLNMTVFGEKDVLMVTIKYVFLLLIFLLSFICFLLSIVFTNNIGFLIFSMPKITDEIVTPEYVLVLLDKMFKMNVVGNRTFFLGLVLLLWIFSPLLALICILILIIALYSLDIVRVDLQPPQSNESAQIEPVELQLAQPQYDEPSASTFHELLEMV